MSFIGCCQEVDAPYIFFGLIMAIIALAGGMTALLQGGVFAIAGVLPTKYIQAVMSGQVRVCG